MTAHTPQKVHELFLDAFNRADVDALAALYEQKGYWSRRLGRLSDAMRSERPIGGFFQVAVAWNYKLEPCSIPAMDWHYFMRRGFSIETEPRFPGSAPRSCVGKPTARGCSFWMSRERLRIPACNHHLS